MFVAIALLHDISPPASVMGQSSYTISAYETLLDLSSPSGACDMAVSERITIRPSIGAVLTSITRTINYPVYATADMYISSPVVTSPSDSNVAITSMVASTNMSVTLTISMTSTANPVTLQLSYTVANVARTYDDDTYAIRSLWSPYAGWNVGIVNASISIVIPSYQTAATFAVTTTSAPNAANIANTDSGILTCTQLSSTLLTRSLICPRHSVSLAQLSLVALQMDYSPSSTRARHICSSYLLASSLLTSAPSTAVTYAIAISFGVLGAFLLCTGICIVCHKYRDDIDACCQPCRDC